MNWLQWRIPYMWAMSYRSSMIAYGPHLSLVECITTDIENQGRDNITSKDHDNKLSRHTCCVTRCRCLQILPCMLHAMNGVQFIYQVYHWTGISHTKEAACYGPVYWPMCQLLPDILSLSWCIGILHSYMDRPAVKGNVSQSFCPNCTENVSWMSYLWMGTNRFHKKATCTMSDIHIAIKIKWRAILDNFNSYSQSDQKTQRLQISFQNANTAGPLVLYLCQY